jgi:hypothetical protein
VSVVQQRLRRRHRFGSAVESRDELRIELRARGDRRLERIN